MMWGHPDEFERLWARIGSSPVGAERSVVGLTRGTRPMLVGRVSPSLPSHESALACPVSAWGPVIWGVGGHDPLSRTY